MKIKKICLIGKFPPYVGGISRHNYCLAKELDKFHETLFIGYKNFYPGLLEFLIKKNKTDKNFDIKSDPGFFNKVKNLFSPYNPFSWFEVINEVGKFKPDIVILPWWFVYLAPSYLFLIASLNKNNIKTVILCHNVFEQADINYLKVFNGLINSLANFLIQQVFKKTDLFIVASEAEKKEILSFHKNPRIKKQLHPVYKFRDDYKPLKQRRENFNLLFFGFVKPYKGLDILLEAMACLENEPVFLRAAGEFSGDKDLYLEIIEKNGLSKKVEITDKYVSNNEIGGYFKESDVVILPYRSGTSSGIIATAYGYQKPVLVTNVGGLPDAVENEKTGKIAEPENPESLSQGIKWFMENKDINFAGNIKNFTEKNMTWQSMAKNIIEIKEL